jgi:hypothetical protein
VEISSRTARGRRRATGIDSGMQFLYQPSNLLYRLWGEGDASKSRLTFHSSLQHAGPESMHAVMHCIASSPAGHGRGAGR